MSSFKINDDAFAYLSIQVGELDELKAVRDVWERAYERNTLARIDEIIPYLPGQARKILDIGSGLGGIDVLLYRWFDKEPSITLIDGDTDALVHRHNEPFNSFRVAKAFLEVNGMRNFRLMEPKKLIDDQYDLIVSFRAWCFHIEPDVYLDYVKRCSHARTIIILDVRKDRRWRERLMDEFDLVNVIDSKEKFDRWRMVRTS